MRLVSILQIVIMVVNVVHVTVFVILYFILSFSIKIIKIQDQIYLEVITIRRHNVSQKSSQKRKEGA